MRVPRPTVRPSRRLVFASCAWVVATAGGAIGGAPDPLPEAPVSAVERDPATGDVWSGTLGAGLLRNSGGRLDRFTQFNSGLAGDSLFDVKVWRGRIYAATTRGISGYDPRTDVWTLHMERRGDVAPTVIVRLVVLPSEPVSPSGESTLQGCSSDARVFRYDPAADAWVLSGDRAARTACESLVREDGLVGPPRPPETTVPAPGQTIAIGILIPMSRAIPVPGANRGWPDERVDRVAIEAVLALRREREGIRPVELSASAFTYERHAFGTPEDTLPILALRAEVAGVVGHSVPRASAESVLASRLGMPIVDAAPIARGAGDSEDPWVFRCDRYGFDGQAAVLDAVLEGLSRPRLAVVRTAGADAARRLDFWVRHANARGAEVAVDVTWDPATGDLGPVLTELRRARVKAILTWSDAPASSALLRGMRKAGLNAAFVGGPQIVNADFVKASAPDAGTVLAVSGCSHAPTEGSGAAPESIADRSATAAAHLLTAVEIAGRDRDAVRGALQRMRATSVARMVGGAWRPSSYGQARPWRGVSFNPAPSGPSPEGQALVARTR